MQPSARFMIGFTRPGAPRYNAGDSIKGEKPMNFFDDHYRARGVTCRLDYAGPLLAFLRGERRNLDYAGPLLAFLRSA